MDDRVIAFDMNAARVPAANGPLRPAPAAPDPRPRHTERATSRAQLASVS